MKLFTRALLLLLPIIATHTACTSDTDYDTVTSGDCIITATTMGTLNRYLLTKSSTGEDSTYRVTVTGSLYPMTIDQLNGLIFNRDSLPYGTDGSKIVFSTFNAVGAVRIRSLITAEDTIFSAADSTDFTLPRLLTVHASDGLSTRTYEMRVNIHREEGDSMRWNSIATSCTLLQGMTELRALAADGELKVYGRYGDSTQVVSIPYGRTTVEDVSLWDSRTLKTVLLPTSIQTAFGHYFALDEEHHILTSADGLTWHETGSELKPLALIAGGETGLGAIADGHFLHSTDGVNWTVQENDEPDQVPTGSIVSVCIPAQTDNGQEIFVAVGRRDGQCVVWRRTADTDGGDSYPWVHIPSAETNAYNCPTLDQQALLRYDGAACLTGLDTDGTPAPFYSSRDNGRTWIDGELRLPFIPLSAQHEITATADEFNFAWYIDSTTGRVWRGRHNRLGWAENQ